MTTKRRGNGRRRQETTSYGVDVRRTLELLDVGVDREIDDELVCLCPMHEARTGKEDAHPSWSINADSGLFNCFSCGYRGNVRTLIRDLLGDEPTAWLISNDLVDFGNVQERSKPAPPEFDPASLVLAGDPPKRSIEDRGLSLEQCQRFGVRWSRNQWIIPVEDPSGTVLGVQRKGRRGATINDPKYMHKRSALFGYSQLSDADPWILVESPLDVVRMASVGVEGGLASFGASVSREQLELLAEAPSLVVALDDDTAGVTASLKVWKALRSRTRLSFLNYDYADGAKDPGELSKVGLRDCLAHAAVVPEPLPVR